MSLSIGSDFFIFATLVLCFSVLHVSAKLTTIEFLKMKCIGCQVCCTGGDRCNKLDYQYIIIPNFCWWVSSWRQWWLHCRHEAYVNVWVVFLFFCMWMHRWFQLRSIEAILSNLTFSLYLRGIKLAMSEWQWKWHQLVQKGLFEQVTDITFTLVWLQHQYKSGSATRTWAVERNCWS